MLKSFDSVFAEKYLYLISDNIVIFLDPIANKNNRKWLFIYITYSFWIIKWTHGAPGRKLRVLFTEFRSHHPHSSVERFHLPTIYGGRGVNDFVDAYYKQTKNLQDSSRRLVKPAVYIKKLLETTTSSHPWSETQWTILCRTPIKYWN